MKENVEEKGLYNLEGREQGGEGDETAGFRKMVYHQQNNSVTLRNWSGGTRGVPALVAESVCLRRAYRDFWWWHRGNKPRWVTITCV